MKISFLAACLFIAFSSTAQPGSTAVKWLTHTDSIYKLSMQYPSDWQLKPPTENARFFVTSYPDSDADNFRDNVNCIVPRAVKSSVTIKMAEDDIVKTLSTNLPEFKIIHSGYAKWNNVNAYEIEYTCTQTTDDGVYNLHMLQKVAIIKGKLYALTFTSLVDSYDKYIATVRRMIQSFRVQ